MGLFTKSRRHQKEAAMGSATLGILLVIAGFPILFLNEGRAVKTARALKEGAASVVSVSADDVDPANEGRFVHLSGKATTDETLSDPKFGVSANAIRLTRTTEMYQWKERTQENTRSSDKKWKKEKTYTYEKVWSARHLDSGSFHDSERHANPPSLPFESLAIDARKVTLGDFTLSSQLVSKIQKTEPLLVQFEDVPATIAENLKQEQSQGKSQEFYWSANPHSEGPQIGDVRIRFAITPASGVSVMAQQAGKALKPFKTHSGRELNMLSMGNASADEMFEAAETTNTVFSWALRILGSVLLTIGFGLMLQPLSTISSWIPMLGQVVSNGTTLVAAVLGIACSLLTISVAWLFYRPLVATPLIAIGVGLIWFLFARSNRGITPATTKKSPPPVPAANGV